MMQQFNCGISQLGLLFLPHGSTLGIELQVFELWAPEGCMLRFSPVHVCCRLARMFPGKLVLGMEIREKVTEYVTRRIDALRKQHAADASTDPNLPGPYQNVSVVRANTMKYMCNYFRKGQLEKLLFLFPDPHFKASNHR